MNRTLRTAALAACVCALSPIEDAQAGYFDRTRFGVGVDLGYQSLLGSNGKAFDLAPLLRVQGEIHPNDAYVVQLIYGYVSHDLNNVPGLFESGSTEADWTGSMEMHYAHLGFKGFADVGPDTWQWFRPFISSSVGLVYSTSRVGSDTLPSVFNTGAGTMFSMDVGAGADLNFRIVSVGVFGRAGFIPTFGGQISDAVTLSVTWPITFGVSASIAI